jgi:phage terminase large subunit
MESMAPELMYSGAFGAGKSRVLCEKALFLSLKYPGNFGGIFRKTRKSLTHTTLRSFFKDACPPEFILKYNKSEDLITLVNGSQLIFGGLDDPQKWGSLELGFVGVDEIIELTEDDYTMLLGRLRLTKLAAGKVLPFRQAFSATNPSHPKHWAYKHFFEERLGEVVEANALENTCNPEDYRVRLDGFKGRYRDRFVLGKWVGFEGLVYDVYDPLTHLITWGQFEDLTGYKRIPADWTRVRSVDFGYANPFVCQWWAISPDGDWFRYREICRTRRLVEDLAKDIVRLSVGERVLATYADHDAEDRATLERHGVPTVAAVKDVSPGIQSVYSLLQVDEVRGRPRLYFIADGSVEKDTTLEAEGKPTCTEDEIQGYAWLPAAEGRSAKEQPAKVNDHGMDATRYAVYSYIRSPAAPLVLPVTLESRSKWKGR